MDLPVPATPGIEPVAEAVVMGPTVASKAAELEFNTQRMFEFVRDGVRYEPYAGLMRGADGTLWSLGGNSADKSMLLAALLDEALVMYRFAVGPLAVDQAAELTTAAMATADDVLTHSAMSSIAAFEPRSFGQLAPPSEEIELGPLTPEEEAEAEANQAAGQLLTSEARASAIDQISLIDQALRDGGITIPEEPEFTLPTLEVERHVWIQVADGPVWIDYDPTGIPGPAPILNETFDVLPEDHHHLVDIRLFAEELIGGAMQRR